MRVVKGVLQFTAPFMNLEILVNEKFSDLSFEYMLYLTLACTSILFGWWALTQLGRFADVEAIMQSANQAATRISLPMIKYLEEKLKDVKATRTQRSTYKRMMHDTYSNQSRRNKLPLRVRRRYTKYAFAMALMIIRMGCISQHYTAYPATSAGASQPEPDPDPGPRPHPLKSRFDTDSFTLGLDGHASRCMSPTKSHFTDLREWSGPPVKGVGETPIEGVGTIKWKIECDRGQQHEIVIKESLYVPTLHKAILSPQHFAKGCDGTSTKDTCLTTRSDESILYFGPSGNFKLTAPHTKDTDVPNVQATSSCRTYYAFAASLEMQTNTYDLEQYMCLPATVIPTEEEDVTRDSEGGGITNVISEDEEDQAPQTPSVATPSTTNDQEAIYTIDDNISDHIEFNDEDAANVKALRETNDILASTDSGELLRYHYKLGHLPFSTLKTLARLGTIPKKLQHAKTPVCAGCVFGKMCKRSWRTRAKNKREVAPATAPGQVVSVDQMESSTQGFIGQLKGIPTTRRYKYATIFVDHYSDLSYVHLQETISSEDTLLAKRAFEAYAREQGVDTIRHYHCDNGRFADNLWKKDVRQKGQSISFCGINAHFQNGRAEKRIRDLRESARTSLLHAMSRWPGVVDLHLWPYALRYTNDVLNNLPDSKGDSKMSRFSRVPVLCNLKDYHSFGCPVYALDNRLASGSSIPHWNPRARLGVHLGFSPRHARNVALVLNVNTAMVSPQFHVKFDDFFTTVSPTAGNTATTSLWQDKAGFKGVRRNSPRSNPSDPPPAPPSLRTQARTQRTTQGVPPVQHPAPPPEPAPDPRQSPLEGEQRDTTNATNEQVESTSDAPLPSFDTNNTDPTTDDIANTRRSRRIRRPTARLQDSVDMGLMQGFNAEIERYYDALHEDEYAIQEDMKDPIAFLASMKKQSDPDTMYYHQAMAAPDGQEFRKAMLKEFQDHCDREHWELIEKTQVPTGIRILDAVWSMKRKRDIKTRETYKWKARLTVHGGQQEKGINFWETYAPVVNWFSIRLLLAKAIMLKWHTRQVDFVLAYPQADVETDIYMKLPRGISIPGISNDTHALKLKKNVYGQRQAGRVWVQFLQEGLRNIGFVPSMVDECVWYRGDVIFTFYVDDGILWCPREEGIEEFLRDIRDEKLAKAKYDIEDKGDITDYLGINFEQLDNGKIHLSQPHLIDQIITEVLGTTNVRARPIPALPTKLLTRDLDGTDFNYHFDYRSIVGKLNYLEKGTRPEIAYAVHQCARFCINPKKSHGDAIIQIAKYLKGTRDRGIIIDPKLDKSLEVYADADFSGNWHRDTAEFDSTTAKSRTGYVVTMHGTPIVWHSKIQTQVALSTTEAEYISLSQSLRDAIPIMNILKELEDKGFKGGDKLPEIHCKAFEDNSGALELAQTPKMRPRTKHINLVYHHFRSYVLNKDITIHAIDTENQTADILTKPLALNLFQKHRKKLLGW